MDTGSICRYLIQARMSGEIDTDILHRKGFDVNMRLFRKSSKYRSIILEITRYMSEVMGGSYGDYDELQGISGANIGIPLNIVGIRATKSLQEEGIVALKDNLWFMINPKIVSKSVETKVIETNCGSIRLPTKIKVRRHKWVEVEYQDLSGKKVKVKLDGAMSCTLQHEVDHNLGVLITDKEEKGDDDIRKVQ